MADWINPKDFEETNDLDPETPIWKLEQLAGGILDQAFQAHTPTGVKILVSGGHDSVACAAIGAAWAKDHHLPFQVVHLDTGIGIQDTQDYVVELCGSQGWDLQIYRARENTLADGTSDPMCYEDIVRVFGFPSSAMHSMMFQRLKERSLGRMMREAKHRKGDRVLLMGGIRKSESTRRMLNVNRSGYIDCRSDGKLWVNHIADFSGIHTNAVMRYHGLPRNHVKDLAGSSFECACGAMGIPEELEILAALFPNDPTVVLLLQLNEEMARKGLWQWGQEVPEHWKQSNRRTQHYKNWQAAIAEAKQTINETPMCSSCNKQGACKNKARVPRMSELAALQSDNPGFVFSSKPETQSQPLQPKPIEIDMTQIDASQLLATMLSNSLTNTTGPRILVTRGRQAGREFYNATIPYAQLKSFLKFEEADLPDDLQAQRPFNQGKAEKVAAYMMENPLDYGFGSLVGVVKPGDSEFIPLFPGADAGWLSFKSPEAKAIADGQHRMGGISLAIEDGQFTDESIGVVFFVRESLEEQRQLFSALNRYGQRPSTSLNKFFDYGDPDCDRARKIRDAIPMLRVLVDTKNTNPKRGSIKLVSFNALEEACSDLFRGSSLPLSEQVKLGIEFWSILIDCFPQWKRVVQLELKADLIRKDYVNHLQITLQAICRVGSQLIELDGWQTTIAKLKDIDWTRENPEWQGVFIFSDRIRKEQRYITALQRHLQERLTEGQEPVAAEEDDLIDVFSEAA